MFGIHRRGRMSLVFLVFGSLVFIKYPCYNATPTNVINPCQCIYFHFDKTEKQDYTGNLYSQIY
jgi:hypothetical protein